MQALHQMKNCFAKQIIHPLRLMMYGCVSVVLLQLCMIIDLRVAVAACWSEWSPCTVTCLGKGESAIFAKRWRIWKCESKGIRDCHSTLNDSVATCQPVAQFKLCADEVPLCVSDEEGDETMAHNALFLINIGLCIAFILLPNVLLSMAFTPGWPCRCRDEDDPSERSVYYSRKHPAIDGDL